MYEIDKSQVRKILVDEQHYKPFDADQLLKDYPPIAEPLARAVQQWLQNRRILETQVEGLTITQIMKNRGYHFLVAVKALNRLFNPDLTEEQRASLRQSLSRPVYYE